MTNEELCNIVLAILKGIAPEIEASELLPNRPLRDQVDLDSMDWLNFLVALHERLAIDIPEADYRKLTTLDTLIAYLAQKRV